MNQGFKYFYSCEFVKTVLFQFIILMENQKFKLSIKLISLCNFNLIPYFKII